MKTSYEPNLIEKKWYQTWEENKYFAPSGKGTPYCIVIPPPNVTGTLHMGHGFQQTIMDALIRYHRMCGCNTLWQGGTDHAGIATQMVVERQLQVEGTTRHQLGREEFIKRVWQWKETSGNIISHQERRLGNSIDWQRERFTLAPDLSAVVSRVFVSLYEEGLIYRGQRLVNWDPVLCTAISDLEVINVEQNSSLWYIRYPLVDDEKEGLIVATTRPETLFGDVAVAVHPDDERYQKLIGKYVKLPLTERTIPIIVDESVVREFGTGCVKITPAHDFNDYAVGLKHKLPWLNIFTPNAALNEIVPKNYQGLDRFVARKKVIAELKQEGLLIKTEPYKLTVPKGDRTDAVIEPYLTDQWFVKVEKLALPAMDVVKQAKLKFVPENWGKIYLQWLENIQDWCISRQLWWGHRIPAWYDESGKVYVGFDEAAVRLKYNLAANVVLRQDDDVLDTWFSAALWPFTTLGWQNNAPEFKAFYPTSVLITGFDIIFFWVVRMVMMGLKFTGQVPFHEVYITGLIRDSKGQKMSKSKGNIIDPLDLIDGITLAALIKKRTSNLMQPALAAGIEKATRSEFPQGIAAYGADAVRFTFCSLASTGRDINFDLGRLAGYRNFCNKVWNAARYVLLQTENFTVTAACEFTAVDHWMRHKMAELLRKIPELFASYRFDLLSQSIYDFVWHEYCDWYLELTKPLLAGASHEALKNGTRRTLLEVLEMSLRVLHPLMPFITEEIWQQVAPKLGFNAPTIMLQDYPQFDAKNLSEKNYQEIEWIKRIILAVRNIRGEMDIAPSKLLPLWFNKGTVANQECVKRQQIYLTALARLASINWFDADAQIPPTATALIDDLEIHIPLANLIDREAEVARLHKEINKLQQEITHLQNKFGNENYVTKAPAVLVEKERQRLIELESALVKLQQRLGSVAAM